MSSKNRKMQRKLEREDIKNKRISEIKKMHLGFLGWANQPTVQIGKTEIIVEAMHRDKLVGLVYQSLAIPKDVLDRLHDNTRVENMIEFPVME